MFTHPYISGQLARERQRDMLTAAQRQHPARQLTSRSGQPRKFSRTGQRLRGALRTARQIAAPGQA
jgi:hypothetical protein